MHTVALHRMRMHGTAWNPEALQSEINWLCEPAGLLGCYRESISTQTCVNAVHEDERDPVHPARCWAEMHACMTKHARTPAC
jgi:hypothetical protein